MKKRLFLVFLIVGLTNVIAQDRIITKNGKITFKASVISFEEVKAINESVTCIINIKTGEIASLALIKGFRFKVALMEEDFNENYMESNQYPKATFRGKIENFDFSKLSTDAKKYSLIGKLEIHGKTKEIVVDAIIYRTVNGVVLLSDFSVNSEDFNIKIPAIVSKKVTKKVDINLDFILQ